MDTVKIVFTQLGIDQTFYIQFAIILVVFALMNYLFFPTLKKVTAEREEKTVGLSKKAENDQSKAIELKEKYESSLKLIAQEVNAFEVSLKKVSIEKEDARLAIAEREIEKKFSEKRLEMVEELTKYKKAVMAESSDLSKKLAEKIIN